jgi:hypothetical protein
MTAPPPVPTYGVIEILERSGFLTIRHPSGHWLRRRYLGIVQQRLSKELLARLSNDSLVAHTPNAEPNTWVSRKLDHLIAEAEYGDVLFIIAESGFGKSVACYKRLGQHVASGGFGLILPHQTIASSLTVEQAIDAALRQLHPYLSENAGRDALALCSADRPFLTVVEDINKSGQARFLTEKLANWTSCGNESDTPDHLSPATLGRKNWRLLDSSGRSSRDRSSELCRRSSHATKAANCPIFR